MSASVLAASSAQAIGRGFAAGSSSGAATGRPIPKPGIAALPQASAGSSARCPSARASARSAATSGSSAARSGPVPMSAADRVVQVGEGEGPPDDRHRVARLEPGLAVRPVAASIAQPGSSVRRVRDRGPRAARPPPATLSISASRVDPLRRMSRPAGSSPAMPVSPSKRTGASNRAPRGKTRRLPGRVTDAEADRALLGIARVGRPPVAAVADGRPVVDARDALEERHQGHLGRFDDAADPDLAGRQRLDRARSRRRRRGRPTDSRRGRARAGPVRRRRRAPRACRDPSPGTTPRPHRTGAAVSPNAASGTRATTTSTTPSPIEQAGHHRPKSKAGRNSRRRKKPPRPISTRPATSPPRVASSAGAPAARARRWSSRQRDGRAVRATQLPAATDPVPARLGRRGLAGRRCRACPAGRSGTTIAMTM